MNDPLSFSFDLPSLDAENMISNNDKETEGRYSFEEDTVIREVADFFIPEEHRASFQEQQEKRLQAYINSATFLRENSEESILSLSGWQRKGLDSPQEALEALFSKEEYPITTGGLFIRLSGKGIAINPGKYFLKRLHEQGYYITDIDHVLITKNNPESYEDAKRIYQLNRQCNLASPSFHLITYHIHQDAHEHLSAFLKPHFKQEKGFVKSLELFVDSSAPEEIEIAPGFWFAYCPLNHTNDESLAGLLKVENHIKIAVLPSNPTSDEAIHLVEGANALWMDLPDDQDMTDPFHQEPVADFLKRVSTPLVLLSRFRSDQGDNRLETARILQKCVKANCRVLPVDERLQICPKGKNVDILCTVTKKWVPCHSIIVAQTEGEFASLHYLSNAMLLLPGINR